MPEITSIEGAWPPAAFGGEPKVEPVVVGAFNSAFPFFPSPFDFPPPFVASFFTFGAPALGVAVLSEVVGATEVAAPLLFAAMAGTYLRCQNASISGTHIHLISYDYDMCKCFDLSATVWLLVAFIRASPMPCTACGQICDVFGNSRVGFMMLPFCPPTVCFKVIQLPLPAWPIDYNQ